MTVTNNITIANNKIHIIGGFVGDNKFIKDHYSIPLDLIFRKNIISSKILETNQNNKQIDKINNTNSIVNILKQYNLENQKTITNELYSDVLINEGFKDIDDLSLLTIDDLLDYNWHKGDAIRFYRKLKQYRHNSNKVNLVPTRRKTSVRKTSMMGLDVNHPYISLLGISKYNSYQDNNEIIYPYAPLPASGKAVEDMYKLFKNLYNYKNTFLHYNESNGLKYEEINVILSNHKQNIIELNKNEKIDCILLFYSGHGDSEGIVTTDLERFDYNDIFFLYNNQQLDILDNYPKIYIFDCCRGKQQYILHSKLIKVNTQNNNDEIKEEKLDELENQTVMGPKNKHRKSTKILHKFTHEFRWFGTQNEHQSYANTERSKSTVMGKAVHHVLLRNLQENKYWSVQGGIATRVNNILSKNTKGQFPDPINRLVNEVYLIPNKNKT